MEWLRTALSALSFFDEDARNSSHEANIRKALRLIGQVSTLVTAFDRIRNGKEPLDPLPGKTLAYNFLYMLSGEEP